MNLELLEEEYSKQVQSCCFSFGFNIPKYTMFEAILNNKYFWCDLFLSLLQAYSAPMRNFKMFDNSAHRPYNKILSSEPDLMYVYSKKNNFWYIRHKMKQDNLFFRWLLSIKCIHDEIRIKQLLFKKQQEPRNCCLKAAYLFQYDQFYTNFNATLIPERSAWQDTNGKR